jgi:Short C-terminal domain
MNRTVLVRLTALVVAIIVVVAVALAAYHFGVANSDSGTAIRTMPMRGRMFGWGYGPGSDLFGLAGMVLIGLLFVWLLAALLSPNRGGTSTPPAAGDLERLHQLSDMHDRGQLSDDEFTAAKRKLLDLQ